MSYSRQLHKLYNLANLKSMQGIDLALDKVAKLYANCGSPCKNVPLIHIAGTNGKGSVSTKIATALNLAGYKVGLFTSPHLQTFRERIRISGDLITESSVTRLLEYIFQVMEEKKIEASFFEVLTVLALLYFQDESVDVAVIEVGLGGRLDATNIITPILSVITSISLDHQKFLGSSLEEIAFEKAGIIKSNIPVILGAKACPQFISSIAKKRNSPFIIAEGSEDYDLENAYTATTALNELKDYFPLLKSSHINQALNAKPRCRYEIFLHNSVKFILDVAHNENGIDRLLMKLKQETSPYSLVVALSHGKDYQAIVKKLLNNNEELIFISSLHPRLLPIQKIQSLIPLDKSSLVTCMNITDYLKKRFQQTQVICGSHFIMDPILTFLGCQDPKDPMELNEN